MEPCPKELRVVLERWKQGKASSAELIEASDYAQLDLLQEYRRLPWPTPPEAVRYRRANPDVRMSGKDAEEYQRHYAAFFAEEGHVKAQNDSNLMTLRALLGWAKAKPLSPPILRAIEAQIAQHQDMTMDEPEPLAV
jgi:hypothetical protein